MAVFPEPIWPPDGSHVDTDPPNSMAIRRDPWLLTGLLTQFARARFKSADNIRNDLLKGYIWSEDDTQSRILIEPAFRYKLTDVQRRPAILVARQPVKFIYPGLGDGTKLSHMESTGRLTGFHKGVDYVVIVQGDHSLRIIGQNGDEAEALAMEVLFALVEYRAVLKREACLGKLVISGLSPLQKMDENQENWSATVELTWAYTHEWTLSQDAPVLKKLDHGLEGNLT
jgi:hypothetical protein